MQPRTKVTCDKQNNYIAKLQKQVAAQQTIIDNQRLQIDRSAADVKNAYGLLEDERNKIYFMQPIISEQQKHIERLEREQQRLINQIENMVHASNEIHAIYAGLWLIGGMIAGGLVGRYWEVLWQLG
jgi:hypothetical protein